MIIGLGHRKSVGKDTIKDILVESFSTYKPTPMSFAYPLKKVCFELYGWAGVHEPEYYERLPGAKTVFLPALGMTVRDLWIKVGINFREIHMDTWAEPVIDKAKKVNLAIITDVRFPNEAKLLKEAGAILIKVTRPQIKDSDDAADCALNGYEGWNVTFVNKSVTLKGLEKDVKKFLVPFIGKFKNVR